MKRILFIAIAALMLIDQSAYATTAQDVFDQTFWMIMQVFCVGLSAGLAIKIINRS